MPHRIATGFTEGPLSTRLFYRHLQAPEARAMALIVHGFGEHSGRYTDLMQTLADRHVSTMAFDYRGHGRADGRRGHVNRFEEYIADVDAVMRLADKLEPALPLVLVGHSIGGLIVAHRLQRPLPDRVVGAALSSPSIAFELEVNAWKDAVGQAAASLWPALTMSAGVDPSLLSHDPAIAEAYDRDPLVVREVTARWYHEAQQAQTQAVTGAGLISVPLLVMQAGDDRIVSAAGSKAFAEAVPGAEYVAFPGMYHELFNETARDEVIARLAAFIDGLL